MAHGALTMTKVEIERGLAAGRTLIQEEWAHPQEVAWVEELIAEGKAVASPWEYLDTYQCERRRIRGAAERAPHGEDGGSNG